MVERASRRTGRQCRLPHRRAQFAAQNLSAGVAGQRGQDLDESLLEAPEPIVEAGSDDDLEYDPDEDPLLDKAIEVVVTAQTASVSLIQRRLRVGYTRAGRLIDMLERRGVISPYEGSKPRRVLLTEADLHRVTSDR